jgi:hypothetical protein
MGQEEKAMMMMTKKACQEDKKFNVNNNEGPISIYL